MRFLHFADLHLDSNYPHVHNKGKYSARTYDAIKSLNYIIEFSNSHNVDCVLLAGDVFNRPNVGDSLKREFIECLSRMLAKNVFIISGQHDLRSDGTSSLTIIKEALEKLSNVSNFYIIDFGYFSFEINGCIIHAVPYGVEYVNYLKQAIKKAKKYSESFNILLCHFPVRGSKVSNSYFLEEGINVNKLEIFDYIAAGDIHIPQKIDNLYYPGNVIKSRFGEVEGTFSIFDVEKNRKKKSKVFSIPDRNYIEVHIDDLANLKKKDLVGSVVRIKVNQGYDPNKLRFVIEKIREIALSVTYKVVGGDSLIFKNSSKKLNLEIDFWNSMKKYLKSKKVDKDKDLVEYLSSIKKRLL